MIITAPEVINVEKYGGYEFRLHLMSDLHIGSSFVDYDLIQSELAECRKNNTPIVINGDLLDLILHQDRKRFNPTALHSRLHNRADVVNAAEEWAIELLEPVADLIYFIGIGNHESAGEKHHSRDSVAYIVKELNRRKGTKIEYGGFCGFLRLRFKVAPRAYWTWTMYRHHGAGGASPVTNGMIDFERMLAFVEDVDCIHIGHKHNRFVDTTRRKMRLTGDNNLTDRSVMCVMTGGYMDTYKEQTSEDALTNGRRASYGADFNLPPQTKGGITIKLTLTENSKIVTKAIA